MDGNPRSASEKKRALAAWIGLLEQRGTGQSVTGEARRYAETNALADSRVREQFIADIMAPAARALLSSEGVWYQASLAGDTGQPRQTGRVVRVVLSFFQAAEPGSMHQVTAYHVDPWDRTFVTADPDGLFTKHKGRTSPWDGRSPAAKRPLKKRLELTISAVAEWVRNNLPTTEEARTFARWHASEVEELKRLYNFFYPSTASQAQGRGSSQTGYFAGSSGYVEKLEEQLSRMIPSYRTFLLSAGEIRIPLSNKKNARTEFSL